MQTEARSFIPRQFDIRYSAGLRDSGVDQQRGYLRFFSHGTFGVELPFILAFVLGFIKCCCLQFSNNRFVWPQQHDNLPSFNCHFALNKPDLYNTTKFPRRVKYWPKYTSPFLHTNINWKILKHRVWTLQSQMTVYKGRSPLYHLAEASKNSNNQNYVKAKSSFFYLTTNLITF